MEIKISIENMDGLIGALNRLAESFAQPKRATVITGDRWEPGGGEVKPLAGGLQITPEQMVTGNVQPEEIKKVIKKTKVEKTEAAPSSKEEPKSYTLVEVRAKLGEISKDGKKKEVQALIKEFGGSKLTEINESDYPALMEKAGGL